MKNLRELAGRTDREVLAALLDVPDVPDRYSRLLGEVLLRPAKVHAFLGHAAPEVANRSIRIRGAHLGPTVRESALS